MRTYRSEKDRRVDREIARLAIPALGTLVAEPLYVLTDTAIVGHLGTDQLAGLALASTVLLTGYAVFVFLAYGTTASVARLLGAGQREKAADEAVQSLWLAIGLGGATALVGWLFGNSLLATLGGHGAILNEAWVYLSISLVGVPALLIALAGTGYLRGLQNTRTPLRVTIAGVFANLVIEVILIHGFDRGIGASALSSVIAQWGVAVAYLSFITSDVKGRGIVLRPRARAIAASMRVGAELLVRTIALRLTLLVATAVAAGMGAATLAAHQITFEIWSFMAMILDSIAIAAQALVGRFLGAGDSYGARHASIRMLEWSVLAGVLGGGALLVVRPWIGGLFTSDELVLSAFASLLIWAAVAQPVNSVAFALDGILIGAGDTRFLALAMAFAAAVFIPLAVLVGRIGAGIQWLWAALVLLMAVRAVTLFLRFLNGDWARVGAG